jgi:hypothetical protein
MKRCIGTAVAVVASLACAGRAFGSPQTSLDKCQKTVKAQATKFVGGTIRAVEGCLKKISTGVIGGNGAVAAAAPSCVSSFRKLDNGADPTKTVEAKMRAKILLACDPAAAGVEHTLQDILGAGAGVPQPIRAENIGAWCAALGGDGSIDTLQEWLDCIVAANTCAAEQSIATQYPRALEWLDLLQPAMAALVPPPVDALAALTAVNGAIEGSPNDDKPDLICGNTCGDGIKDGLDQCDGSDLGGETCASRGFAAGALACDATCGFDVSGCSSPLPAVCGNGVRESYESCDGADLGGQTCGAQFGGHGTLACTAGCGFDTSGCIADAFPATGQTTCWDGTGSAIACAGTGQDGDIQAGATLSYVDNGDGTITDLNTRLTWEKHGDNGDIHDWDNTYTWADAFAVHVGGLNTASFAGQSDWRLPNRKELETIADLGATLPSIDVAFRTACIPACDVSVCSCTSPSDYWSNTNFQGQALAVTFDYGYYTFHSKGSLKRARAVRGGL